jgi:hypothetical protein
MSEQPTDTDRGEPDRENQQATARGSESLASAPAKRPVCDLCGALMVERHCKLICSRCGYIRDCSDP